jgi:hypothetical protein
MDQSIVDKNNMIAGELVAANKDVDPFEDGRIHIGRVPHFDHN